MKRVIRNGIIFSMLVLALSLNSMESAYAFLGFGNSKTETSKIDKANKKLEKKAEKINKRIEKNNKLKDKMEKVKNSDKLSDAEKELNKIGKKVEDGSVSKLSKAIKNVGKVTGVVGGAAVGTVAGGHPIVGGAGAAAAEGVKEGFDWIANKFD